MNKRMSLWSVCAAALVAGASIVTSASAQSPYTDAPGVSNDPGAQRVPELVAAYNSGDADRIMQAVSEHFTGPFLQMPAEQHVGVWRQSLRETGPLELLAFRSYDPPSEELVPIFKSTVTGGYFAFVLGVDDETGKFTGAQFAPARTPSFVEPGEKLAGDALLDEVDTLITRMAAHDMFSGTIVIAKDGKPIYERAVGLASRRFDVPNNMETRFNLGSMNKMFTSVAIAQLVEEGKLSFDDTVGQHLPAYGNEEVRNKVRIKHLLSHTSGMGSHFTREFMEASKVLYRDIDDYTELFVDEPLAFEPGTDWAYSNAGFYVLGSIIEAASGETYFDYIREHVYKPAGMSRSDSFDMDIPIKNLAIGYTSGGMGFDHADDGARWLRESPWRNNNLLHSIKGGPAGGGFSTSHDLIRFATALRRGTILSPSSFETIASAKPELSSPDYGFGFGVGPHPGAGEIVGHSGGFPGINAQLDIYLDAGYDVAVMANMDGAASMVAQRIQAFIGGTH